MALDDLAYKVGEVKGGMKAKDVKMEEEWWQSIACHNPHLLVWHVDNYSEKQIKYFIELLDNVIQDNMDSESVSENMQREAEQYREELIEYL